MVSRRRTVGCAVRTTAVYMLTLLCLSSTHAWGDTVKVAVASNFRPTLEKLAQPFESRHGHRLRISAAATGVLYQQIRHGADFHVFLAADSEHPQKLADEGRAAGEPFTYALGRLALAGAKGVELPASADTMSVVKVLAGAPERSVAIANPRVAPYGAAAEAVYRHLGLWESTADSRVEGSNIGHTYLLLHRGHARYGFVALSQVQESPLPALLLPADWYPPIRQRGVLLQSAADHSASRAFVDFLRSDSARAIIEADGYRPQAAETP